MFDFYGHTAPLRFLRAMAIRLFWLAVFTFGYPFIHRAILSASGCGMDSCGAVGLITALAIKPTATTFILLSLPAPLMRRSRDAGLPAWLGLVPLVFVVNDILALALVGAPWAMSFTLGQIGPRFSPTKLLFAVWLIGVLGALPTSPRRDWKSRPLGRVEIVAAIALAYLAITAVFALSFPTLSGRVLLSMSGLLKVVFYPVQWLRLVVVAATAWILWSALRNRAAVSSATAETADGTAPRIPANTIIAIAAAAAVVQWSIATYPETDGLRFALDVSGVIVPTAAIDALLLVALWLVAATRTRWSAALLVVALVPFGLWAGEVISDLRARAAQAGEIAAIPVTPLASRPDTLVYRTSTHVDVSALIAAGGFTMVLGERNDHTYWDATPRRVGGGAPDKSTEEKPSPPPEHLVLLIGNTSSFHEKSAGGPPMQGPFELRLRTPTRDDLVAVSYDRLGPRPVLLPILGVNGWYRTAGTAISKRWQNVPVELVARAVAGLPAR